LQATHEALQAALAAAAENDTPGQLAPEIQLDFYETTLMPAPTPSNANPIVDLIDTVDQALYIALLAPKNVSSAEARAAIANEVLSIGVAPALVDQILPIQPTRIGAPQTPAASLIYEIADVQPNALNASYTRLPLVQAPDVLNELGIVQVQMPGVASLQNWSFSDPMNEGLDDFPPRIEDAQLRERIITWLRLRYSTTTSGSATQPTARLTWVGINAARITQVVSVFNELLGTGNGEPDQSFGLANTPVITESIRLVVEGSRGAEVWRLTDDLLAAAASDLVFSLDPEAGVVRFGDGLRGLRPPSGGRISASYEYGGGLAGNVAIGAIKSSTDVRLQGGFTISNPLPTWGGDTGQSLAEAERSIPLVLRHRDRAVTEQDFRDVAQRTPGVDIGRVEVLPLFNPNQPDAVAAGTVTVLAIPRFDPLRPRWPIPDRIFLKAICDYLEPRRLVTTEVYLRGPVYRDVYVTVGLQVRAGHFRDIVRRDASARLYEYLSALPPGGPDAMGWPLNKRLLKKDLEAVITRVAGVEYVQSLHMGVESTTDIDEYAFSNLDLPVLSGLSVVDGDAEQLTAVVAGGSTSGAVPPKVVPVPVIRSKC
jgi:hypothetical protein